MREFVAAMLVTVFVALPLLCLFAWGVSTLMEWDHPSERANRRKERERRRLIKWAKAQPPYESTLTQKEPQP